jgi:hypothetical protein
MKKGIALHADTRSWTPPRAYRPFPLPAPFIFQNPGIVSGLTSVRIPLDNDLFEQSVSIAHIKGLLRQVILCFCALLCHGHGFENHTTAIILLSFIFAIDNADLEYAKTERIDNQYYGTSALIRDDRVARIHTAESFKTEQLGVIDPSAEFRKKIAAKRLHWW